MGSNLTLPVNKLGFGFLVVFCFVCFPDVPLRVPCKLDIRKVAGTKTLFAVSAVGVGS